MLSFGYDGVVLYVFWSVRSSKHWEPLEQYLGSCRLVLLLVSAVCFCVW